MKSFGPIWEGIYNRFSEAPAKGSGFTSRRWVEKGLERMRSMRKLAEKGKTVPEVTIYPRSLLPIVAAMVEPAAECLQILDFGGSLGFDYYPVKSGLAVGKKLSYHIVENDLICQAGQDFFSNESDIFFHTALPHIDSFDIIHLGSSLHYVEEWQNLIARLSAYHPQYVLFTDLAAGDIPTYASLQNYYESKIPTWFFSIEEIDAVLEKNGFHLAFKSSYMSNILGEEQSYPQENFEPQYRLGYAASLLYRKGVQS